MNRHEINEIVLKLVADAADWDIAEVDLDSNLFTDLLMESLDITLLYVTVDEEFELESPQEYEFYIGQTSPRMIADYIEAATQDQ